MPSRRRHAPALIAALPASRLPLGTPRLTLGGSRYESSHERQMTPRSLHKTNEPLGYYAMHGSSVKGQTDTTPSANGDIDLAVGSNIAATVEDSDSVKPQDDTTDELQSVKLISVTLMPTDESPTASLALSKLQCQHKRNEKMDPTLTSHMQIGRRRRRRVKSKQWKPFDFTAEPSLPSQTSTADPTPSEAGADAFRRLSETHSYVHTFWNSPHHASQAPTATEHYGIISTNGGSGFWKSHFENGSVERCVSGNSTFGNNETDECLGIKNESFSVASKPEFSLANDSDHTEDADHMIVESVITSATLPSARNFTGSTTLANFSSGIPENKNSIAQHSEVPKEQKAQDDVDPKGVRASRPLSAQAAPWTGSITKDVGNAPDKECSVGLVDGELHFLEHRKGDVSAHQWSHPRQQWENFDIFPSTKSKIEDPLTLDRFRGQKPSETLQQNTLDFFRNVAKQRETIATERPVEAEERQGLVPVGQAPFTMYPSVTQRIARLLGRPIGISDKQDSPITHLQQHTMEMHESSDLLNGRLPGSKFTTLQKRFNADAPSHANLAIQVRGCDSALVAEGQGLTRNLRNAPHMVQQSFTASTQTPIAQINQQGLGGYGFPVSDTSTHSIERFSAHSRSLLHDNQCDQSRLQCWYQTPQSTSVTAVKDFNNGGAPNAAAGTPTKYGDIYSGSPAARPNKTRVKTFSPHANPFSPFSGSHSDRLDQLVKIGHSAKERIRGQSSSRTVLYDPLQDARTNDNSESDLNTESPIRTQSSVSNLESRTPVTPPSFNMYSRQTSNMSMPPTLQRPHSLSASTAAGFNDMPKTSSKTIPIQQQHPINTTNTKDPDNGIHSDVTEFHVMNCDRAQILAEHHHDSNVDQASYDEKLSKWWKSGTRFARHEDFFQHIKATNQDNSSLTPGGRQTAPWSETITRLLIPVQENLAAYVQGPESKRRDYFTPWSTPPDWAIDSDIGGNKSFYEEHWGTPPVRFGRDPRYRRLPLSSGLGHGRFRSGGWRPQFDRGRLGVF